MREEAKMSVEKDFYREFITVDPYCAFVEIENYIEPQIEIAVYALDSILVELYDRLPDDTRKKVQHLLEQADNVSAILKNASRIIPIIRSNHFQALMEEKGGA